MSSTPSPTEDRVVTGRRTALALGSGGARGYAHIGAIQVLRERGHEIVAISGTSMGALVGAACAAGKLDDYTEWAAGLSQRDVLRLLDPSLRAPYGIRGDKMLAHFSELIGKVRIEDLPIPYTAVATDLLARKEIWFQQGPLDVAVRASVALPSFMTPVMLNGRLLADGGLMNPVPIAPMAGVHADLTVAISLGGERRGGQALAPVHETSEPISGEDRLERFRKAAAQVRDRELVRAVTSRFGRTDDEPAADEEGQADSTDETTEADAGAGGVASAPAEAVFEPLPPGLRTFDVMDLSIEAMQTVVTKFRMAGYPPDLLVEVPKDACRTIDFHRAAEMIELGRSLTAAALDRFEE
jgi:NTE family protein